MGSLDRANISGFLCRLCSEMHRTVIHIYGDKGRKLSLVEKINGYLPISISCTDPLPKTICFTCMRRVEQHYNLLMRLSKIRKERVKHIEKDNDSYIYIDISIADYSDDELESAIDEETAALERELTGQNSSPNLNPVEPTEFHDPTTDE